MRIMLKGFLKIVAICCLSVLSSCIDDVFQPKEAGDLSWNLGIEYYESEVSQVAIASFLDSDGFVSELDEGYSVMFQSTNTMSYYGGSYVLYEAVSGYASSGEISVIYPDGTSYVNSISYSQFQVEALDAYTEGEDYVISWDGISDPLEEGESVYVNMYQEIDDDYGQTIYEGTFSEEGATSLTIPADGLVMDLATSLKFVISKRVEGVLQNDGGASTGSIYSNYVLDTSDIEVMIISE